MILLQESQHCYYQCGGRLPMIVAPFGSLALQLFPDLRIVTRISPGSATDKKMSHCLPRANVRSNRIPQLKKVLNKTDTPYFIIFI